MSCGHIHTHNKLDGISKKLTFLPFDSVNKMADVSFRWGGSGVRWLLSRDVTAINSGVAFRASVERKWRPRGDLARWKAPQVAQPEPALPTARAASRPCRYARLSVTGSGGCWRKNLHPTWIDAQLGFRSADIKHGTPKTSDRLAILDRTTSRWSRSMKIRKCVRLRNGIYTSS